jgi:methylated-DNA-[protein]-cysteine S-methyltransferase
VFNPPHLTPPSGYFHSPLGVIAVHDDGEFVMALDIAPQHCSKPRPSRLTCETLRQLRAYFSQRAFHFDLPFKLAGTPYQQKVWLALSCIPYGETRRYGELAQQLDSSPRAIGGACRANPLPIIIPCHRVIARNGIGGYSGATEGEVLDVKYQLLHHEQSRW